MALVLAVASAQEPGGGGMAPPVVPTDLKLENPSWKGTGPYTVTVKGTLSLSKDEKGFIGTSAIKLNQILGDTYNGLVNLPDGQPQPGMAAKQVIYTWTVPNKGTYNGSAKMAYTNSLGKADSINAAIPLFEIK